MKFKCGPTKQERSRIKIDEDKRRNEEYVEAVMGDGLTFFALWPRRCADGYCRVFERLVKKAKAVKYIRCSYLDCDYYRTQDRYTMRDKLTNWPSTTSVCEWTYEKPR